MKNSSSSVSLAPDVVIAGAPRSGTTSLYTYLKAHPSVCGSEPKETLFLLDDGYPLSVEERSVRRLGVDGYRHFFPGFRSAQHDVLMEATPDYLYQDTAREFLAARENVKIIFILRRPQDRVLSVFSFAQNRTGTLPSDLSFTDYIASVRDGSIDSDDVILSDSLGQSRYIDHLQRWIDDIGQDRILVLKFEDMQSDPRATMYEIASFVGLDPAFYDDFPFSVVNSSHRPRLARIDHLIRRAVRPVRHLEMYNRIKARIRPLYSSMQGVNAASTGGLDVSPQDEWLAEYFADANRRLQATTGLDVGSW